MQLRQTIKRHVKAQVEADLAGGLLLSDEQYAKMQALLRGARLPDNLYSDAYTHLLEDHRLPAPSALLEAPEGLGTAALDNAAPVDDSGFFEVDGSEARHSVRLPARDNLSIEAMLDPSLADDHRNNQPDSRDNSGSQSDDSGPRNDDSGSRNNSDSRGASLNEVDIFWDAPEGSVEHGHDIYRDSPALTAHVSPAPSLMAEDAIVHALGNMGDFAPLVFDNLELDRPAGDSFSDWSSEPGEDRDMQDLHDHLDVDAPLPVEPPNTPNIELQEAEENDVVEISEHDPDFVHVDELFDPDGPDSENTPPTPGKLPAAFEEDSLIRRAYVQAFIAHSFHSVTHTAVEHMLKSAKSNLASLSERLGYVLPGLEKMAVTLRTVERRLGVDPNQYITYFFLCNKCWKRHHSSELYELVHKHCLEPHCDGILYDTKVLAGGKRRRAPVKPFPTSSLEYNIQRMLMRPGKVEELNAWRQGQEDEAGIKPPIDEEDWLGAQEPDLRLFDVYDGWGWNAIQAGLQRRRGGEWEVEDVDIDELCQRFVALPLGLVLMINIDWFRGLKRGKYSVGAIYATLCNNPRSKRFLSEETILLAVIPGPEEPPLEHLNNILEPFVAEAARMYRGVGMCTPSGPQPMPTHLYVNVLAADLPGSRKTTGLRSHTSKLFMCAVCNKPFPALVDHRCYEDATFKYRDDGRYLKYAFRARNADDAEREEISERRGIRWSVLDLLPDWLPSRDGPPDFMHAAYLGEAKHVVQGILVAGGMFTKRNRTHKPLECLQAFFDNLWWPGSAGRVPSGLITGGAGKADEWRNTCSVLPVALYDAWQVDGSIPDANAPKLNPKEKAGINHQRIEDLLKARRHENAAYHGELTPEYAESIDSERMDRNYRRHYDNVLEWLVALRIFGSRSISIREAQRAQNCHAWACQAWSRLNCHLTPYFHILSHLVIWIYRLGPVYGWWTYPYERFNGFLCRLQHNGHPGELEATMMRGWVRLHLIHDLSLHLKNLGDAQTRDDQESIADLHQCLQGRNKGNERGTLLTMLARMSAQSSEDALQFPKQFSKINLKREGLYAIVFTYLRRRWEDKVDLIPDTSGRHVPGSAFVGLSVPSFSHVVIHGQRYGASTAHRGRTHQYAFINGREAVQINNILQIMHSDPFGRPLLANIAVVQPFIPSNLAEVMPWHARAADLGIGTWKGGRLGAGFVIDLSCLSGHFALAQVPHHTKLLWVSMSLSHDGQEPDQIDQDTDETFD